MNPLQISLQGQDIWVLWAFSRLGLSFMEFGLEKPNESFLISQKEKEDPHPSSWDKTMKDWVKSYEKKKFLNFPLPFDLSQVSPFQAEVLQNLSDKVPAGKTVSYQGLAALAGRPMAHRAVGSTMANNPLAFAVPCHRVLHSGGTQTSYGKGVFYKYLLLKHEDSDPALLRNMRDRYKATFPVQGIAL